MIHEGQAFAAATDEKIIALISRAKDRLVIAAPALTNAVADALSQKLRYLGHLDMTVILDADPEVYRLGFGDPEALETFRRAAIENLFDLREQRGIRIGLVIADDTVMVYSPVSRNIEAGSRTAEAPNAIVLSGAAATRIATAAGAGRTADGSLEIGDQALTPARVAEMQADLKANPPQPFDITRRLNVFTSKVQYVDLSVSNYRLAMRKVALPDDFVDVGDDDLKDRITSHIRAPFDGIGKIEITIEGENKPILVDEEWLEKERKRIEEYTFVIKNFGRVILFTDKEIFGRAAKRFEAIAAKYQAAVKKRVEEKKVEFENRIVSEFTPRWLAKPPKWFERWRAQPTRENIEKRLRQLAGGILADAVTFEPPVAKINYMNVSAENIRDRNFVEPLKRIMIRKQVPDAVIDSLFESGDAAPASGAFINR